MGTFDITVTGARAALTIAANQRAVVRTGGALTGPVSAAQGSELCIETGGTANTVVWGTLTVLANHSPASTITGVRFGPNATLMNTGSLTFTNYVEVLGAINASNAMGARLHVNTPYFGLNPGSSLTNRGSLTFRSQFEVFAGATFNNQNTAEIGSLWQPNGTVINDGFINARGDIDIAASAQVSNRCWLYAANSFLNNGSLSNSGVVRAFGTGTLQNNGTWVGGSASWVIGNSFDNYGPVSGAGTWRFTGTTNNAGAFAGDSAANPIRFYDVSRTAARILDGRSATLANPPNTVRPPTDPGVLDPAAFTPGNCAPPYRGLRSALLTVTKSNGVSTVTAGMTTTYSIIVANGGPDDANGTVLTDVPSEGLACSVATCSAGGAALCPTPAVTASSLAAGQTLSSLPANSSLSFSLTCLVTASGRT